MKICKINRKHCYKILIHLCKYCLYAVEHDACATQEQKNNNGLLLYIMTVFAPYVHTLYIYTYIRFLVYVYVYVHFQAWCTLEMSFPANYGGGS